MPSPVTATTWPLFRKAWTSKSLSLGEDLPITYLHKSLLVVIQSFKSQKLYEVNTHSRNERNTKFYSLQNVDAIFLFANVMKI